MIAFAKSSVNSSEFFLFFMELCGRDKYEIIIFRQRPKDFSLKLIYVDSPRQFCVCILLGISSFTYIAEIACNFIYITVANF